MLNTVPRVIHRYVDIDDVRVFYRASVPDRDAAPTLLLLHGFPSASHQFRRLIDALGDRYRLIAPDYPGFGFTQSPESFVYSFDGLAGVMERFIETIGLTRFAMYVFDFGAPIGFRIAMRHPDWIGGLIVQNANAYDDGLTDDARNFISLRPEMDGAEQRIRSLLTLAGTRSQYASGIGNPEALAPDGWTLDQHFLDQPGRTDAQITLAFDYHSNLERYGDWQRWLREQTPPTLIVWGRRDPFFSTAGAFAYLEDVPEADLHVLPTGHFALEEHLKDIAPLVAAFLDRCELTSMTDAASKESA